MDLRQALEQHIETLKNNAKDSYQQRVGADTDDATWWDGFASAQLESVNDLTSLLTANPAEGFDIRVSEDAPDFKAWRKIAQLDWIPEGGILAQINEHFFDGSALWLGDDGNWFAHIGKRIVRRYEILPAGSPAPSAPTQEVSS